MGKWTIGRQPRARDGNVEEPKWSPRHTLKLHQFINKRFQCKKKQKKQHHWSPLKDWRKSAMKQIVGTHVPAGLAIAPRTVFGLGFLFFFLLCFLPQALYLAIAFSFVIPSYPTFLPLRLCCPHLSLSFLFFFFLFLFIIFSLPPLFASVGIQGKALLTLSLSLLVTLHSTGKKKT